MNKHQTKQQNQADVRYSIILNDRAARFYRHILTACTFVGLIGGSALLASQNEAIKQTGFALAALVGFAVLALKPMEKAVAHENDSRKYRALLAKSHAMSDEQLLDAFYEACASDVHEIERLRDVAYNQLMQEIGREDCLLPLTFGQRVLAKFA